MNLNEHQWSCMFMWDHMCSHMFTWVHTSLHEFTGVNWGSLRFINYVSRYILLVITGEREWSGVNCDDAMWIQVIDYVYYFSLGFTEFHWEFTRVHWSSFGFTGVHWGSLASGKIPLFFYCLKEPGTLTYPNFLKFHTVKHKGNAIVYAIFYGLMCAWSIGT